MQLQLVWEQLCSVSVYVCQGDTTSLTLKMSALVSHALSTPSKSLWATLLAHFVPPTLLRLQDPTRQQHVNALQNLQDQMAARVKSVLPTPLRLPIPKI
jgi:hypothetical protein